VPEAVPAHNRLSSKCCSTKIAVSSSIFRISLWNL